MPTTTTASPAVLPPLLTFLWQHPERWYKSRLLRFVLVSVLGHFLAFLLFQIVTPENVTAPDRERELQILSHDLPEHQALLQALEAEVPLAALSHQLLPPDHLLERPYRSAFAQSRVQPVDAPRWKPISKTLIPVFASPAGAIDKTPVDARPFLGRLLLDPNLEARRLSLPEIPSVPNSKSLESPRFIIGLAGSGEVQFLFLDKSSGDAQADALAESTIKQTAFHGGTTSTVWGEATLVWRTTP